MNVRNRLPLLWVFLLGCSVPAGCHRYSIEQLENFMDKEGRLVTGTEEYRMLPPDVLSITSENVPEINGRTARINPEGKITLPLLGRLYVANMTAPEIERALVKAALEYYEEADATVEVIGYNSRKYYVFIAGGGGPRAWTGSDTLFDALTRAAGSESRAWLERVKVFRPMGPTRGGYVPDPKDRDKYAASKLHNKYGAQVIMVNLKDMVKHGDMSRNILLKPDDIVYVPRNPIAWLADQVRLYLQPISPVLEVVRTPRTITSGLDPSQFEIGADDND